MLLLERDPLVRRPGEENRVPSFDDCSAALPMMAPRRALLVVWVLVVALAHFDRGVVCVAAMDVMLPVQRADHLSFFYVAGLLGWHSVGLCVGSALAGSALQRAPAKAVLLLALLGQALALLPLGLEVHGFLVSSALRLLCGFAAAFPLAYLPLWVDEFAPVQAQGRWMAAVQLGTTGGHLAGLVCAAVAQLVLRLGWRAALLAQAACLLPPALYLLATPAAQVEAASLASLSARLDSLTLYPAERSGSSGHVQSLVREVQEMLQGVSRNPLTLSVTAVLCLLHTTGAGLALWICPFLALSPGAPPALVSIVLAGLIFALVPVCGTCAGALLCEYWEGFKAGHRAAALRAGCVAALLAAAAAPAGAAADTFAARLAVVCLWLFGAGAFLPISAGVLMASMPSYLRSFASTASLLLVHLVSYGLLPSAVAAVMSCFTRSSHGLGFGVGVALWTSVPAVVLLTVAVLREPRSQAPTGLAGLDDLTFGDIGYELARRRMTTAPL